MGNPVPLIATLFSTFSICFPSFAHIVPPYARLISPSTSCSIDECRNSNSQVIAYKAGNESWAITGEAVLIVDDVNDNYPEIEIVPNELEILENTYLSLELEKFIVNDIDLVRLLYNWLISKMCNLLLQLVHSVFII